MYCKNCGEWLADDQAFCVRCGMEKGYGRAYCHNCGTAVSENSFFCTKCGAEIERNGMGGTADMHGATSKAMSGIQPRSIVTAVILSLVTCGIYSIYWFIKLTDEMNQASGRTGETSGGMAFLFSLLTCGIYEFFWAYKMGEKRDIVAKEKGAYSNVIYLVLMIFGLGIVAYGLMQDTLNKAIEDR